MPPPAAARGLEERDDGQGGRGDHHLGGWFHHRAGDGPDRGLGVGGERLHYWVFGGPWSYESPPEGEACGEDKAYLDEMTGANGAVIAGRGTYEAAGHWGGANPWDVPLFIVTHRPGEQP